MKKIIKKILIVIIIIGVCIGLFFLIKYLGTKQLIADDITDINIVCSEDKNVTLKDKDINTLIPYLNSIYEAKLDNFSKWDLNKKIIVIINKNNRLKITDYSNTNYYGYYNDDSVVIPKEIYKEINKFCKE